MFSTIYSSRKINKTELTVISTRARVMINNEYREEFKVEPGIKQGDPLSATLFSVAIDVILKQLGLRGNIPTHSKQVFCL